MCHKVMPLNQAKVDTSSRACNEYAYTAGIPACWVGEKSMKKKGRRQSFYPAPPFFKTFVPKSHVFKNSLLRASLLHRLVSDQESGNACRVRSSSPSGYVG